MTLAAVGLAAALAAPACAGDALLQAAQKEGALSSIGMPDTWANWVQTWKDLQAKGIKTQDTDMSSAEEISKMQAEGANATADIGDVSIEFGEIARKKNITMPYKPSTWDQVPAWAKDKDGHWAVAYTGTVAFIINKDLVKAADAPKTWKDLAKGKYRVTVGAVGSAAQANYSVLAAALALGGDEKNLKPAYELFAEIAKQGRLSTNDPVVANLEKGEVEVGMLWDFNALNYRDQIDRKRFDVVIPADGSVMSGYTTIINRHAPHPNAAKYAREYIFSDQGQINLAGGYARPIRAKHLKMPADVAAKMLPEEQYANARPVKDQEAWTAAAKKIARNWQSRVVINMK
ncbi:MAG: extracellular solute-binding protein [Duodenibacillus sp.]|nr:extracellular solute-binding protein [Duodenibacillus sp.]